nr:hypothetical protein [Evansella caseinilytica]
MASSKSVAYTTETYVVSGDSAAKKSPSLSPGLFEQSFIHQL